MQKIFYNAEIHTFESDVMEEAMLVNDGSIVFVGEKADVFNLKTDETQVVDLKQCHVFPALFDTNISLYKIIEDNLKNANQVNFIENNAEIDLNYDKFDNFDIYKSEFLKLQTECLKNGITTIFEMGLSNKEFIFWKKMSEAKLLKIDIIGFVDIINFKFVMDDNCRSYRKYKNHFRLGGYFLELDGTVEEKRAWLTKPYLKEGKYAGFGNLTYEQLSFLIKTALEEKKQLAVFASGDNSVEQLLECLKENKKDKSVEDMFRPFIARAGVIKNRQFQKVKDLGLSLGFFISDVTENFKLVKNAVGSRHKGFHNLKQCNRWNINYVFQGATENIKSPFKFFEYAKVKQKQYLRKKVNVYEKMLNILAVSSAWLGFDDAKKGTLENGKNANFFVCKEDLLKGEYPTILQTYIEGERVFGDEIK